MAPSVALMVKRIELNHAPIDMHAKKAPLCQQPAATQALPFCPVPLWSNGSPSIPNFSRPRLLEQDPNLWSGTSSSPKAPPEVNQEASSSVAPKEDGNSQMLEVKRRHLLIMSRIEVESSDELDTSQPSDHPTNWPLVVDGGFWFGGQQKLSTTASTPTHQESLPASDTPKRQVPSPTVCTPVRRSPSIQIKMEPTSPAPEMMEKPRGPVSAVTTKPGFPIIVSSLLREFENLIKSTIKIEKTSPTPSLSPHGNVDTIKSHNPLQTQTIYEPIASGFKNSTSPSPPPSLKPPSSLASPSLLSFLEPPTPTPFSTTYGIPNNAPYAPNLHFVSGSTIEQNRPTEWGRNLRKRTDEPPHRRLFQPNHIHGPIAREYGYHSAGSLLQGQGRKTGRLCKIFKKTVKMVGLGTKDVGLLRKR
ncbi:hypothetical protein Ptr902_06296 [Pyrenophora tritici-repentis]|nr:hypothetical protein Alg130_02166 [Pyrenophora tritici-repentis]KAI2481915.1 hypothetical protein Ptr902_06296 [Pyrenophora tritici-repentis]